MYNYIPAQQEASEEAEATMTLVYNPEQEEFRSSIRRFLEQHAPEPTIRQWADSESGFDRGLWADMAVGLGLPGLLVPEEHGGSGAGATEVVAVFEETGRALFGPPLLATGVLSSVALRSSRAGPTESGLWADIAAGSVIVALAERDFRRSQVRMSARGHQGSWTLSGTASNIISGQNADVLLIPAAADGGLSLFAVDRREGGAVEVMLLDSLDQTRRQANIQLDECPARLVGPDGGAPAALEQALAFGALAVAAEALGGAGMVLESAVEYSSNRVQFGRSIGSFQAIKHRCADMKVLLETSRAAVMGAAEILAGHGVGRNPEVSLAKVYASDAFFRLAADNLQVHGGIGCTWEHPAHLYLRRAKALQHLLGSPSEHRAVIAQHLGLQPSTT